MFQVVFIFSIILFPIVYTKDCVLRDFGHGGHVCVCNATYCDDFPPLLREKINAVTVVETNKKGDRFKRSFVPFNATHSGSSAKKHILIIDSSKRYQTILGFGGAFTDTSVIIVSKLPKELGDNIIKDYFSENGLEYTMGRIPIAASDFSPRHYSYDDISGDFNLTHFSLAEEDLKYKIPYLKLSEKLSPHKNLKWFGSPWSPPEWMKSNSSGFYGLEGKPGDKYFETWAKYFVKFLDEYKSNGIHIWGITVDNEPVYSQKINHKNAPNQGMKPETQRDFVKYDLGPALEKAGYGLKNLTLMIFDDNIPTIEEYTDVILNDANAAKYVSGIAFHWYSTNDQNIVNLQKTHNKHQNYFLLSTEACMLEKPSLGNWINGEKYAYNIIQDLNHNTTGWIEWNMVLEPSSGMDSSLLVNQTSKEYYKQPMYYSMGHFSKFLPPDSVRVALNEESKLNNLVSVALVRPDNATVVIVQNKNEEPVDLTINSKQGVISHTISAHSLQSYIWKSNH